MFVVEAAVKTISLGVVRYITDRYRDYQSHTGPDYGLWGAKHHRLWGGHIPNSLKILVATDAIG